MIDFGLSRLLLRVAVMSFRAPGVAVTGWCLRAVYADVCGKSCPLLVLEDYESYFMLVNKPSWRK